MADLDEPTRTRDPAHALLGAIASAHVCVLVFTESYRLLPAAAAGYAAAWWVVRRVVRP